MTVAALLFVLLTTSVFRRVGFASLLAGGAQSGPDSLTFAASVFSTTLKDSDLFFFRSAKHFVSMVPKSGFPEATDRLASPDVCGAAATVPTRTSSQL